MSCAAFTGGVMMRLVQGVGRKWMSTGAMVVGAGLAVGVAPSTASAMRPLAGGMTRTDDRGTGSTGTTGTSAAASDAYRAYVASMRNGVAATRTEVATSAVHDASAKTALIPAFARKYGLRCSACHTSWPELNAFGQAFRDNGYQLMNDRDSPIWQNPSYFPISARITPQWHLETTNNQPVDITAGNPGNGQISRHVTADGFDLSGMDLWMAGTLYKNISFTLLASSDPFASFHFEAAFVRFDNINDSPWLNAKFGRFETDNLISEKRFLFLSANGGIYQTYHFNPVGDANDFGIGDNQLGFEVSGHNIGSYTRYSLAVYSSSEGNEGLVGGSTYDGMAAFSQAFPTKLGLERVGVYGYLGERSTVFPTSDGTVIPGDGQDAKPFYRVGAAGDLWLGKFELLPFFLHGWDNVYLGTSTPVGDTLPTGAKGPTWNGGFLEAHYQANERFVALARYEVIRMSTQALATSASNLGNIDAYSAGFRWAPFMFSRAGLAVHGEWSITKNQGAVPLSGDGVGLPPLVPNSAVWSNSVLFALDFAF
jgi:hypothetical protein